MRRVGGALCSNCQEGPVACSSVGQCWDTRPAPWFRVGGPGLQKKLSQGAERTLSVPMLPSHRGFSNLYRPSPGSLSLCPFSGMGVGQAYCPNSDCGPILPGGADVQHEGGGGLGKGPPVGAGTVPRAHPPPEKLLSVRDEVCHPGHPSWTQSCRGKGSGVCV